MRRSAGKQAGDRSLSDGRNRAGRETHKRTMRAALRSMYIAHSVDRIASRRIGLRSVFGCVTLVGVESRTDGVGEAISSYRCSVCRLQTSASASQALVVLLFGLLTQVSLVLIPGCPARLRDIGEPKYFLRQFIGNSIVCVSPEASKLD